MMRLPTLLIVALTLMGIAASGRAQPPRLVVLGDSLSAAYGIDADAGWVSLLKRRLDERGLDCQVVNASVSGETTAGGLSRLPGLLQAHRPRILVIALGANDGLRGFDFDTIRGNLTRMIELARAGDIQVLLAGIRLPPNYGAAYTEGFQAVFREVAEAQQVPLVPVLLAGVEGWDMMQADGIHPSAAAQPRILDNVWQALEPLLTETASSPKPPS
jgi:acyl-CoA thioesterase I